MKPPVDGPPAFAREASRYLLLYRRALLEGLPREQCVQFLKTAQRYMARIEEVENPAESPVIPASFCLACSTQRRERGSLYCTECHDAVARAALGRP